MPLKGRHPYDVSKACADLIAHAYAATYQLPVGSPAVPTSTAVAISTGTASCPATIRSLLRGQRPVIRSSGTSCAISCTSKGRGGLSPARRTSGGGPPHPAGSGLQLLERDAHDHPRDRVSHHSIDGPRRRTRDSEQRHQRDPSSDSQRRASPGGAWLADVVSLDEGLRRTIDWYRTSSSLCLEPLPAPARRSSLNPGSTATTLTSGPRFSILMPTRNRAHLLRSSLQSVIELHGDDFEVVVDDMREGVVPVPRAAE